MSAYVDPPSGWYTFGTHAGWDNEDIPRLQFSHEQDEAGMPLFEKPYGSPVPEDVSKAIRDWVTKHRPKREFGWGASAQAWMDLQEMISRFATTESWEYGVDYGNQSVLKGHTEKDAREIQEASHADCWVVRRRLGPWEVVDDAPGE